MIELDRNIGHNSVMSIREFFIDRDEPARLVDQVIHDMEVIGYTSAEGANGMCQLFAAVFFIDGSAALSVSVYMNFLHGWGCGTASSHRRSMAGKEWTEGVRAKGLRRRMEGGSGFTRQL